MFNLKGNNFGKKIKKDVKVDCHISIGKESLDSEKVDVEILDEECENKFLAVSLTDDTEPSKEVTIIISTNDLKRILEAAEESYKQSITSDFFLGTKEAVCPFCNEKKTLLLLKGGMTGCKPCLDTLAGILKGAGKPSKEEAVPFRTK